MTALKGGLAFSNAWAKGAGAVLLGTMAKERREGGCGESEGAWSAFVLRLFGSMDVG
jgi:hypothetical protein